MKSVTAADPKARADIEDDFRKTVGQALGGIFVLLGAGLAYYGTFQTLQANEAQARRSQQAARDLLISNQVSKGFEQFGSDNIRVRLGGIYALEGVMNTSKEYHQPVLEALSAFVRDRTRTDTGDGPPATDIQAVLTVIGRRKPLFNEEIVPFRTTASGKAAFRAPGPNLDLVYIPKADLVNATLNEVSLEGANLSGADLFGVNLSGAHLNGANLSNANLSGALLVYAYMTGAQLTGANLTGANLTGANLIGAQLTGVNLTGAHLGGAHLNRANLNNADVSEGADLSGADLTGADLTRAIISQTQLDKACGTNVGLVTGLTIKPCGNQ